MAFVVGEVFERSPEKLKHVAVVVQCLMTPLLGQGSLCAAKVKRPYLISIVSSPTSQVGLNNSVIDTRLLCQLTQSSLGREFSFLDSAFHQLRPC